MIPEYVLIKNKLPSSPIYVNGNVIPSGKEYCCPYDQSMEINIHSGMGSCVVFTKNGELDTYDYCDIRSNIISNSVLSIVEITERVIVCDREMTVIDFYYYCVDHNIESYRLASFVMNRKTLAIAGITTLALESAEEGSSSIHIHRNTKTIEIYNDDPSITEYYGNMDLGEYIDMCEAENDCHIYFIPPVNDVHITVIFGCINKFFCPRAIEDDYYIIVWISDSAEEEYNNTYRISITEPKYIYDSKRIPDEYKETVVNAIISQYRTGLEMINEDAGTTMFDPNRQPPDYNLL